MSTTEKKRVKLSDLEFATAVLDYYAECTLKNLKFFSEGLAEKTGMQTASVVNRCDRLRNDGWKIPEFARKETAKAKRMTAAEFNAMMDAKAREVAEAIMRIANENTEAEVESEELELA